mmetsp:Transcript_2867/g.6550  ORF Transcript_2867/g.6550 Transcript_2867/m.6550 type:complete len:93 (-) Transcript_2867:361-639(-)
MAHPVPRGHSERLGIRLQSQGGVDKGHPRASSRPTTSSLENQTYDCTTATDTDNLPALSWSTKGAVSSKGLAAYLLRHQDNTYHGNPDHLYN